MSGGKPNPAQKARSLDMDAASLAAYAEGGARKALDLGIALGRFQLYLSDSRGPVSVTVPKAYLQHHQVLADEKGFALCPVEGWQHRGQDQDVFAVVVPRHAAELVLRGREDGRDFWLAAHLRDDFVRPLAVVKSFLDLEESGRMRLEASLRPAPGSQMGYRWPGPPDSARHEDVRACLHGGWTLAEVARNPWVTTCGTTSITLASMPLSGGNCWAEEVHLDQRFSPRDLRDIGGRLPEHVHLVSWSWRVNLEPGEEALKTRPLSLLDPSVNGEALVAALCAREGG